MSIVRRICPLILVFLASITPLNPALAPQSCVAASGRTLAWSVVATPSDGSNGMVINTLGINSFALGPDGRTFYAADTANDRFYKSTDAGYSWLPNIAASLTNQGAFLPVWNVVVAQDDTSIVMVVSDNSTGNGGPRNAFLSTDSGGTWLNTGLVIAPTEYISCLDISRPYGANNQARDIAVGTRTTGGGGRLLTRQYSTTLAGGWADQAAFGITSVKISPSYATDQTIAVVSIEASMFLHLGKHDSTLNSTVWDIAGGYAAYPVNLPSGSPATTINTSLELPSDYLGTDLSLRGCFVNVFTSVGSSVFYISGTPTVFTITPPAAGPRIYSIAYSGTNATGILLAGEADSNPAQARVNIWQSSNAQATCSGCVTWLKSDTIKSPTGGATTLRRANALLAWSPDGSRAYCGTSSDNSTVGGTGSTPGTGQWPFSKQVSVPLDESAFSYSTDNGFAWNQIGLINTRINQLSDVAATEQAGGDGAGTLYLSSLNTVAPGFDSVWRSTSDPLGLTWERILTRRSSDETILRINPIGAGSSQVIVFADLLSDNITYSSDSGNTWSAVLAGTSVKDIALVDDNNMYVLDDYSVRKLSGGGSAWTPGKRINTQLSALAHTLCVPEASSSIVFVGTEGNSDTQVAWVDFSVFLPKFTQLKELPVQGDVHVITDDKYDSNKNIYVGINIAGADDGNIYRWTMDDSTNWDELDPINRSFYGLCMLNDILYGAWTITTPPFPGVDRTLDARVKVPPAPEWDELRDGLPNAAPFPVFTREPTSLHVSSNAYNTLWAIDNQAYDFTLKRGCLWQYVDSVAKLGPWPTAPPPGGFIGPDPSSGRSQQIDIRWRPLKDIFGYDVLIAKDVNFTLLLSREVSQALSMAPLDGLTGAWVVTPADQENPSCWISPGVLEVGRSYYWKVRGSRSILETKIHSPWSPTLSFSVKPGFRVTADYMGPTLLTPLDGICGNCKPPIRFSWSPVKDTTSYEFILAKNAQLTDIVVQEKTKSTAFEVKNKLQLATTYYWQVKAVAPIPGDPSPVGTFSLTENKAAPQKPPATTTKPGGVAAPGDFWIWIIIVIVVVLLMLINAYVFISRRRDG